MNFPDLGRSDLLYPKEKPLDINGLKIESNPFRSNIREGFFNVYPISFIFLFGVYS